MRKLHLVQLKARATEVQRIYLIAIDRLVADIARAFRLFREISTLETSIIDGDGE